MSNGVETRAQIDTETMKALLLVNGGGALALLALLPSVLDRPGQDSLAKAILIGVIILSVGLFLAIVHNRLRRKCSLLHAQNNMRPPAERLFGIQLRSARVCFLSDASMWLSAACFMVATVTVAAIGFFTI
jgi:hypothetical protein